VCVCVCYTCAHGPYSGWGAACLFVRSRVKDHDALIDPTRMHSTPTSRCEYALERHAPSALITCGHVEFAFVSYTRHRGRARTRGEDWHQDCACVSRTAGVFSLCFCFAHSHTKWGADQDAVGVDPMPRAYLPALARAPCCMWTAGVSRGRVPLWWSSLSHHVAGVLRVRRCRVEGRATQGVSSTYQPPHFDQWPYPVLFPPWHRLPRYSSLALT